MHPAQIDDIMVLPQMYAGNTLHIMVSMVLYFPWLSFIGADSANACVYVAYYYTITSIPSFHISLLSTTPFLFNQPNVCGA